MQEKRTLYLAGKITGDPYYFTKFYNAQKKLEEGGFIVVNPALLPAEGFTWEAYMRMSGAMLAECAEVCFLPDWKESKGAKYEFGEAMAQNKPFFFFADWERTQEETGKYECTAEKTDKIAFQCFVCGKINVFPATHADGNTCKYCGGGFKAEAGRLRAEGVKAGVPDLCLPVARGQYHGLYIELKRQRGGRTSDHQSEWLDALSAQGYKAALCYGWEQAAGTIIEYLTGGGTHD